MEQSDHSRERRADDEEAITRLAARQYGVVTRTQLLAAGISGDVVDRRLKAKRLQLLYRGVYLVGPLRVPRAHETAAVLACGYGAMVSHSSAAALLQLQPERDPADPVDVSAARGDHFGRPGIRFHRAGSLRPEDVTELDGIPLTTVSRTLYDLASVAGQRELERAVTNAVNRGVANRAELEALMKRCPRRRGTGRLRELLAGDEQPALTRSQAEDRFLALLRKGQMPAPAVNVTIGAYVVDFFWRAERFIVEVDGFAFHSSSHRFESDRRRDAELAAAGMRVVRVTWRQLAHEPEALLVRLAKAMAH
jgi:very-short-patch-repair endonuclease